MFGSVFNISNFNPKLAGCRLDKLLFLQIPGYSRTYFQELIDEGFVTINGKIVSKSSYLVQPSDRISLMIPPAKEYNLSPIEVKIDVIEENEDFIVINKPAGLVVYPSDNNKEEISLVCGLLQRFPDLCIFEDKQRPGIVHRLDRDTSGLMLVARNDSAQREFLSMFKKRLIHKTYLAVVAGHPQKSGKIDFSIGRHPLHRHKMSHKGIAAREAESFYETLAYYKNGSLVSVRIITGRTHQIRVHLSAIGHGILGDALYGYRSKLISRQALHSWNMSFEYKGKKYEYCLAVPDDMKDLLKRVKEGERFN